MARWIVGCLTALFLVTWLGCDAVDDGGGTVILSGQVLNAVTNNPVEGALVSIEPLDVFTTTDANGRFTETVEIDSALTVVVTASKEGFTIDSEAIPIVGDETFDEIRLTLTPTDGGGGGGVSGPATNILLGSQSAQSIGVKESGSPEVVQITFIAADSSGRPITIENATEIRFRLGAAPPGAFISPERAMTDNNGRVTVNVSSGQTAGVVQLVAEATVNGTEIRSLPVAIAIHGGLPDEAHFTLGPQRFNFPGLRFFGLTEPISVIVGDKFGNPVRPGTAVYFTTTHGVIEGSAQTNDQGGGSVSLISGNPLPTIDGIATIIASTGNEDTVEFSDSTYMVFSGAPVITVSPSVAILGQTYRLTVTDPLGNPLVEGTTISVAAEGTNVQAVGNTEVTLDDTIIVPDESNPSGRRALTGPGITQFTFAAVRGEAEPDDEGNLPESVLEAITIRVSGENGDLEIVLTPGASVQTRTDGARVEVLPDGTTRVLADDQPIDVR